MDGARYCCTRDNHPLAQPTNANPAIKEQSAGHGAHEYVERHLTLPLYPWDFVEFLSSEPTASFAVSPQRQKQQFVWLLRVTNSSSAFQNYSEKRNIQLDASVLSIDPAAERADQSQPCSQIGHLTPPSASDKRNEPKPSACAAHGHTKACFATLHCSSPPLQPGYPSVPKTVAFVLFAAVRCPEDGGDDVFLRRQGHPLEVERIRHGHVRARHLRKKKKSTRGCSREAFLGVGMRPRANVCPHTTKSKGSIFLWESGG